MKLVILSDTHCQLDKVKIPDGDFLIHCGDALGRGTLTELAQFNYHLVPHVPRFKRIIYVPGNHDIIFENDSALGKSVLSNAETFIHQEFKLELDNTQIKGFASPYTPKFFDWAFMYPNDKAKDIWSSIPEDTEFLITHGPPNRILDTIPVEYMKYGETTNHVGCPELRKVVKNISPLLHAFGHIHSCGQQNRKYGDTLFVNAAICRDSYEPLNKPMIVDIVFKNGVKNAIPVD